MVAGAVDLFEDLFAREHAAARLAEREEHVELGCRQLDVRARTTDLARALVDLDVAKAVRLGDPSDHRRSP